MQYSGITSVGPWDLFEISEWTEEQLKDMVESLPALPPLNYENLNKRLGQLKKYPLENSSSSYSNCFGNIYTCNDYNNSHNRFGHL